MKNSYLTAGITISQLSLLVRRNKITASPKNIFRLVFLYQSAAWSSLFAFIEEKRFGQKISSSPLPPSPVFIIGHWRTGSTLLHKIMSLDPGLAAPTLFDVAEPDSLLTSHTYYKPVMKAMISRHRPMDNVVLGMDEPQEDEYAIYRITKHSPLERMIFPSEKKFFLRDVSSYLPESGLEEWKEQMRLFYRKLYFKYNRNIVSKNPFNSLRIQEILDIFPQAKFIHILRHPYEVVPSSIHMWDIVQRQNVLNGNAVRPTSGEVSEVMKMILSRIENDRKIIPHGQYAEIYFSDLEKEPEKEVRELYKKLNIPFVDKFSENIKNYFSTAGKFEKNSFTLTPEEKNIISSALKEHMSNHGFLP